MFFNGNLSGIIFENKTIKHFSNQLFIMKDSTFSILFENNIYNINFFIEDVGREKLYHLFPEDKSPTSRFGDEFIIREQNNKEWDCDVDAISEKMEFFKSLAWGLKKFQFALHEN